jgi:DNA polymerase-4
MQKITLDEATQLLGAHGTWLHDVAHGRGTDELSTHWTRKSISREETFSKDLISIAELEHELHLRKMFDVRGKGWRAQTVQVKIRYHDFSTHTSAHTIEETNDDPVVYRAAQELLHHLFAERPVRLLGVHLSNFTGGEQLSLSFSDRDQHRERMLNAVDAIRAKFGENVIHVGHA